MFFTYLTRELRRRGRQAFVIAGSDQRGTIYGAYDVSRGIGVSPWYYWDDVRPAHHASLFALPGRHSQGTPHVKYRGIFINDENPSLGTWAPATFGPGLAPGFPGGFNANFYARVFEAMLRLKANYLWPAVWGRAFNEDDPVNQATATAYGVVMGTSHEAPMLRGIEEWNRHAVPAVRDAAGNITTPGSDPYGGTGEWSFRRNGDAIKAYWTAGIQRMVRDNVEGIVTIGMRGNGDVSLPDGDGIDLMRQITSTERQIIGQVTGKDPATVPQVWTLYKEVQRYWDQGLRVPDDVTVVFTKTPWELVHPPRSLPYRLRWATLPDYQSRARAPLRVLSAWTVANVVRRELTQGPPAVVHAQGEEAARLHHVRARCRFGFVVTPRYPSLPPGLFAPRRTLARGLALLAGFGKYAALGIALGAADVCAPPSHYGGDLIRRAYRVPPDRIHLMLGSAVDLLAEEAERVRADIVVMGAVSRSRLQRIFVGNTAERVLDHLPCDVLIVKPTEFASDPSFF